MSKIMRIINVKFRMLKLFGGLFVALFALVIMAGQIYADSGTWVDGNFPALSAGRLTALSPISSCYPSMFDYWTYTKPDGVTFDSLGRLAQTKVCQLQNDLGYFGASSNVTDDYNFVKPNTSTAFRVVRVNDLSASITPVPNGQAFFTKDGTNSAHGEVAPHFYDSFLSAGSFGQFSYGTTKEIAFQLNQPGSVLKDAAGKTIYMHAYAFSPNGQWMVIEAANLGFMRVNVQTRQMQLFSTEILSYNLGFTPKATLAISDDGNSVIKSGNNAGETIAYDLSGCQPGPFTTNGNNTNAMVGCRSRVLTSSLQSQMAGFAYLTAMHFSADGKSLSLLVGHRRTDGTIEYFSANYAVAGYQQPHVDYIALGDSFSSGEGAYDYELGTNEPENTCHLSKASYPYLTAAALNIPDFHSVACSGAKVDDYRATQYVNGFISDLSRNSLSVWQPGYKRQADYVKIGGSVSVVTISMIGNDIGFADKLKTCMFLPDDCYRYQDDRRSIVDEVNRTFDEKLVPLYQSIKNDSGNPDSVKVYVLGYPQIMGTGPSCPSNVPFSQDEREMAEGLISYLDAVIKQATVKVGVQYIDVEHAFDGHRLCEAGVPAVNGLSVDASTPLSHFTAVANSSFHPNALGHQLLSEALMAESSDFTKPMPIADSAVKFPSSTSPAYTAFVNAAPVGGVFNHLIYEGNQAAQVLLKTSPLQVSVTDTLLKQNSQFQVWFHSTPTFAGSLTSDANGELHGSIDVPSGIEPGYHVVEIKGQDMSGQNVDLYQGVYVAASADDVNGNGALDSQEQCVIVPPSGVDHDKDGIDDACDPEITDPPADSVPPSVTGVADREPDYASWYNHDVNVAWSAVDPDPSSGAPTVPEVTMAAVEGDQTYESQQSCDPAGNCASGKLEIKLDKTLPTIDYVITPVANSNGWNNGAVTITFTCNDAISGIESCSDPTSVSADGSSIVTGTAVDNAGNSQSINVIVSIDQTAPTIDINLSTPANAYGWNNTGVTVTTTCADALSGVAACSSPQTLKSEGGDQIVASSALDNADNRSTLHTNVSIDTTAPTVQPLSWSANPKAFTGPSILTARADDNLSGAVHAEYFVGDTDPGLGNRTPMLSDGDNFVATFGTDMASGVYKVTVLGMDRAGNWSAPSSDYLVVYNPFSLRIIGKRTVVPSLATNDSLPGLTSLTQSDSAKFAFNVGYSPLGTVLPNDDFQFSYSTGDGCNKPNKGVTCHTLDLNATSVDWALTQGTNNSVGIFQGRATLVVDGAAQVVTYKTVVQDGERLSSSSPDHLTLYIFAAGESPNVASPIYQINDDVLRGNIHIKS